MDELNWIETGGMVGHKRRLQTMTIRQDDDGTFRVTDDLQGGRWRSCGHASIADAVKANRAAAERRSMPMGKSRSYG